MRKPLVWYALANIGAFALIPPVVVGILLPSGLLVARSSGSPQVLRMYIDFCATLLAPALAAWWPPFVFRERIEGSGRELLYLLRPDGEAARALVLTLMFLVLLLPFVLLALGAREFAVGSVLLLASRCIFIASLAFCAAFVLHSSALGLTLALLFNMVAMTTLEEFAASLAPSVAFGSGTPVWTVVLYAALSTALMWVGEARSRHFTG